MSKLGKSASRQQANNPAAKPATSKANSWRARLRQDFRERNFRARPVEPGTVFLNLRRVYIIPTGAGWGYALMLVMLFIGSINYTLSLGFALTFLLTAVGLIDIHMTYRNLAHLYLTPGRCNTVFAGEAVQFEFAIENRKKVPRYAIWVDFVSPEQDFAEQAIDIEPHSSQSVSLTVISQQRGWLAAPRLRLRTRFPLGLLLAWSYWQPEQRALIYPFPEIDAPPLPQAAQTISSNEQQLGQAGQDDFAGVRTYQRGDSLKHLAWRQIAKLDVADGGQLLSKQFEGGASTQLCLDFDQLPNNLDVESKLSRLTRWVLQAEQAGLSYSFTLGNFSIPQGHGIQHQTACLRALALYGKSDHA